MDSLLSLYEKDDHKKQYSSKILFLISIDTQTATTQNKYLGQNQKGSDTKTL